MTVDEAISYLRKQAREQHRDHLTYAYVLDAQQQLLGVCRFRDLFAAQPGKLVRDVMKTDLVTVLDTTTRSRCRACSPSTTSSRCRSSTPTGA